MMLLLYLLATANALSLSQESIYYVTLDHDGTSSSIAQLSYANAWLLNETGAVLEPNDYCVSLSQDTPENVIWPCFNYEKIESFPVTGAVTLQGSGDEIQAVSLLLTPTPPTDTNAGGNLKLIVKPARVLPLPIVPELKPVPKDDNKEPVKKEEDKTFFEKYWMFIVPPLIMVLIQGQGQ